MTRASVRASVMAQLLVAALVATTPVTAQDQPRRLDRREILAAMRLSQGYDPSATTNAPRFQAEVMLRLARQAAQRDPARGPLLIERSDWFFSLLERCGLPPDRAPLFARLSYEHGQDTLIEHRMERVLEEAGAERPLQALAVKVWWPDAPGAATRYAYDDLLSTPRLRVVNERVITYRLLDLGDMMVFADIQGLRGRPTTGVLGLLFRLIGEGQVVESRMAVSADGLQITRARARKGPFAVESTVTVQPDGRTEKDVPAERADLKAIEARLRRTLRLKLRFLDPSWTR